MFSKAKRFNYDQTPSTLVSTPCCPKFVSRHANSTRKTREELKRWYPTPGSSARSSRTPLRSIGKPNQRLLFTPNINARTPSPLTPEEQVLLTPEESEKSTPEELVLLTPEVSVSSTPENTVPLTPEDAVLLPPEKSSVPSTPENAVSSTPEVQLTPEESSVPSTPENAVPHPEEPVVVVDPIIAVENAVMQQYNTLKSLIEQYHRNGNNNNLENSERLKKIQELGNKCIAKMVELMSPFHNKTKRVSEELQREDYEAIIMMCNNLIDTICAEQAVEALEIEEPAPPPTVFKRFRRGVHKKWGKLRRFNLRKWIAEFF